MFSFDPEKLKHFASTLNNNASSNDERDTAVRGLVSLIVKGGAKMIHKKYLKGISKDMAALVSGSAVTAGYVLRKVTHLGPFADNIITDMAQEIADQVLNEYKEGPQRSKEDIQKLRIKLIFIGKTFLNAARSMNGQQAQDLFTDFTNLMEEMSEANQLEFIDSLSKFDKNQLIDFMKMSADQKKKFFAPLFSKEPEKKPKGERFAELKGFISEGADMIGKAMVKIDNQFAPGTTLNKQAKRFKNWANNIK